MKKFILAVFALLLMAGAANATNIPTATDPKNYPTVWTELVYNGSGSDIASCSVVLWDFDTSDSDAGTIFDDTCSWVKIDDDEASPWTAGVTTAASAGIVNGAVGRIVIRGPAVVHHKANVLTVNTLCSSDGTGGAVNESASTGEAVLGCTIKVSAAGNDIEGDITADYSLIYINPTYCVD